ncbi:E3 ubiquitin-protein ligase RNF14-like isoform X1 [Mytilus galloprovincialis]|uniref:E3 ubiquitin-protein ligase RNF14-like isoform X1 n=1 Tax=Mytilus galloprovincialis TaxID=29158 RepID=UPI003F7CA0D0
MAEGGREYGSNFSWSPEHVENLQEQKDEVSAFQCLFEVEGDQRFSIISDGPLDLTDDQMFSLQFFVPVKSPYDVMTVNVCIPEQDFRENDVNNKDVLLQRSESRNTVFASFSVKFLTPLRLTVVLSPGYPSCEPPIFTLSSSWLNGDQLTSLCIQLDKLWNECPSMPILFSWIDWLEHNIFSYLGISDKVFVRQCVTDDDIDTRAVPDCDNIDDTVNEMLRYNMQEEITEFLKYDQECGICFCEKSGRDFDRLLPCKHHFCRECMAEHCSIHVKEGTVQHLLCPEPKCETEIRPYILKEVLNDDDYERWERLILQHGLDTMGDIIYCPRCQNVVVKEEDLGHCLSCLFTFCTKCLEKWHQGDTCFFEKEVEGDEEGKTGSTESQYVEESEAERKRLQRQRRAEMNLSYQLIRARTRQCWKCKSPIEKNGGCNKVTCSKCFSAMCWACGRDITKVSYGHFSDNPKCAELITEDVMQTPFRDPTPQKVREIDEAILEGGKAAERNVKRCPRCRQRNLRENRNNHIKCWNCKNSFCFLCNELIKPPYTKHFTNTLCKQHSKHDVEEMQPRKPRKNADMNS